MDAVSINFVDSKKSTRVQLLPRMNFSTTVRFIGKKNLIIRDYNTRVYSKFQVKIIIKNTTKFLFKFELLKNHLEQRGIFSFQSDQQV